jgi:type VI secretion system protein ImpL
LTDKDRSNPELLAEDFDPYKTLPPQGRLREVQSILARAHAEGRRPDQLTDEERAQICELVGEGTGSNSSERSGVRTVRPNLMRDHEEVERCVARLRHLCKLIARDRRPFCPINGMLALVSLMALTDDEVAGQAATVYQYDLTAVHQELQLVCPVFAVVCDVESSPGFAEFLSRFPGEQRFGRLGHRFPLFSELDAERIPANIETMAHWICRSVVPAHVYKLFQTENFVPQSRAEEDDEEPQRSSAIDQMAVVRGNSQLYQFLVHVRRVSRNLARVLKGGVIGDPNKTLLFGGCYLSGTGNDPKNGQGFVAGVFRRLKQCEDSVAWTPQAFAEETEAQRWAQWGYIALGCVVAGVVLAAVVRMSLGG